MRAFVINLDRNPERWEHAQMVLSAVLDDVERIPAVDGQLLTDKWQYLSHWMHLTHEPDKFNIKPAIGCYLSHRKCWQHVVDNDLPHALILEDDIAPTPLTKPFLDAFQANPPPLDWVRLHVNRYGGRDPQKSIGMAIGGIDLCVNTSGSKSNGAYVVSNAGARKLLTVERILAPVDHVEWFHLSASIVFAQTEHNIFDWAHGLGTNISPDRGNILQRLPAIVRIGLVRNTIGKAVGYSNLRAARKMVRQ
jgi:glycosyl transferase, family 25